MTTRRRFLKQASGGALILGLPQLLSDVPVVPLASPLERARARMIANGLHGVAIAIPKLAESRKKIGRTLEAFVAWPIVKELRSIGLEAVYVCAPRKSLPIEEGENIVLLAPDGKRVAGANISFASSKTMAKGFRKLLNDDGRRKRRVDKSATPRLRKAMATIVDGSDAAYPAAHNLVWNERTRAMPLVVAALEDPDCTDRTRMRLRAIVDGTWSMLEFDKVPTLPFGLTWKITKKGFDPEPCPPCGMARPTPPVRKFLKFAK